MKIYKFMMIAATGLCLAACSDINEQLPEGGDITESQLIESTEEAPSRGEATFSGMFTMMGEPYYTYGSSSGRADDFGFIMMAISQDLEGPDASMPNSGYNWFSVCGEMTSRTPTYANPYIRYAMPYNQIGAANNIIKSYPADTEDATAINKIAQARAIRAFDYMSLAPYFQFNYQIAADQPCVPIVTEETTDFANNPRATVAEVYAQILADLDYAIAHLDASRSDKAKINQQVAYGLRARAYLNMGKYAEAAADAEKAMEGYTPASIAEVSVPSFYDINDHNWIWGIDLTQAQTLDAYATSAAWLGSFSSSSYSAGTGCYASINCLLYNKIPTTDVRKGWWMDENLHSDLLTNISWAGVSGDDIATLEITNVKKVFTPYVNVKFGMAEGIGATMNDNDWPLMRVEEMILIAAEGYAKSGNESKAREMLTNFVKTYRNPEYTIPASRSLADEIWFQRRVELWGEGFAWSDLMRLQKPLVRFHEGKDSNVPEAFQFNMASDDPWMLMRFPRSEMNSNLAVINNTGGNLPVAGQNGSLRDGVTD
jgi:starch-binding outer membrane protein, SusD/RagB family